MTLSKWVFIVLKPNDVITYLIIFRANGFLFRIYRYFKNEHFMFVSQFYLGSSVIIIILTYNS